jgi:trehalose 6-phosphate phosphatase
MRRARRIALFLDLDGTLVPLRKRPEDVRVPARVNDLLGRLAGRRKMFVAIVSGRCVWDLSRLIDGKGVHLYGIHGAEEEGKARAIERKSTVALTAARLYARLGFRDMPKVWIEDKGLSFAVHYRGARSAAKQIVKEILLEGMKPFQGILRLQEGDGVWEVIPKELRGKGAIVRALLGKPLRGALGIYMGDDASDEPAFAALRRGITVHVGGVRKTKARFRLARPSDTIRFLCILEKELS